MPKVTYQIIDELDTKCLSENRSILKCVSLFKKGDAIVLGKFIRENLNATSPNKQPEILARVTFKSLSLLKANYLEYRLTNMVLATLDASYFGSRN